MFSLNILDYSPVDEGSDAREALLQTTELAKRADQLGYRRFWVSEHHNVLSVANSSPEMLMMHLATSTSTIRIGSGGVMLPHYSSYKVAENFRMLEALHPNRIDLGVGRSPSYQIVNKALNEEKGTRQSYEQKVKDLQKYLTDNTLEDHRFRKLMATPKTKTSPEIWMLGTSSRSGVIAAENGSAYVFGHFANPSEKGIEAVTNYRKHFKPSSLLEIPNTMIALFAVVADTEEEAEEIAKAFDLWLLFVESNNPPAYYPSIETAKRRGFSSVEQEKVSENRKRMIIGTPQQVKEEIEKVANWFQADEVMIIPNVSGFQNRLRGIELLAEAFQL
ncbi:LLM class flavin-dependent oxidoreductase [Lentibacillus sp. Marseille-P4043]|uniref:LLM class flavin-dependent oxidoreductase n=1 Tax=Lentibacillus sp. Marseille-P4043 TaxID=2040293 RepID=UPI000D0AF580|nr:LLM class flavin-dependent oxidoreductase [Lentibacillus sp. Marseille-P4043]